jgi:hypothetical protein
MCGFLFRKFGKKLSRTFKMVRRINGKHRIVRLGEIKTEKLRIFYFDNQAQLRPKDSDNSASQRERRIKKCSSGKLTARKLLIFILQKAGKDVSYNFVYRIIIMNTSNKFRVFWFSRQRANVAVSWDVATCRLLNTDRRFRGANCRHHQDYECALPIAQSKGN